MSNQDLKLPKGIFQYEDSYGQVCYGYRKKTNLSGKLPKPFQKEMRLGPLSRKKAIIGFNTFKKDFKIEALSKLEKGMTWRELLQRFHQVEASMGKDFPGANPTTRQDYINALKDYTAQWYERSVKEINSVDVEILYGEIKSSGRSHGRCRHIRSAINFVFDWSVRAKLLDRRIASPARGAKLGRDSETKKQAVLKRAEIELFLKSAFDRNHEYTHLWSLAFGTGMRSGELYALRWTDIDFDRRQISINKSFSGRIGRDKCPKSGESRTLWINDELMRLLKEIKLSAGPREHTLPRITSWRRGEASKVTRDHCDSIGVTPIRFHDIRACWAVQMLEAGVEPVKLLKLGGWSSFKAIKPYVRESGVEIVGSTDEFSILPGRSKIDSKVLKFQG